MIHRRMGSGHVAEKEGPLEFRGERRKEMDVPGEMKEGRDFEHVLVRERVRQHVLGKEGLGKASRVCLSLSLRPSCKILICTTPGFDLALAVYSSGLNMNVTSPDPPNRRGTSPWLLFINFVLPVL